MTAADDVSDPYTMLTVVLTKKSRSALDAAAKRRGDNATDTVNRALQVYNAVTQTAAAGGSRLRFEFAGGRNLILTVAAELSEATR